MKKLVAIFAVFALAFVIPTPTSAAAADPVVTEPGVTIYDFGQYLVQKGKKATVELKWVYELQGGAKATYARMTVKQGKKTLAKNVRSAKLRAGTYKVTITIKWTATGGPTVNTTVATKTLKVSTFSGSKQAAALLKAINAARLKVPGMADAIKTGKALTLRRSSQLDKIATGWATKSAKKGKYVDADWNKLPDAYQWGWHLPWRTYNPYYPTLAKELGTGYLYDGSPLAGCGVHEVDDEDWVSDCSDDLAAPWANLGIGFAWDKKGQLWVSLLLTSAKL
jgi:hypothetical protein